MKALGTLILAGMLSILPGARLLWAEQINLILADDSSSTDASAVQSSSDNSGSTATNATIITVNSLADSGGEAGICTLRSAITAANTMTATNGCPAGTGNDTIRFSVSARSCSPARCPSYDSQLTINGPPKPGITIDGGGHVQVMQVASGATHLTSIVLS